MAATMTLRTAIKHVSPVVHCVQMYLMPEGSKSGQLKLYTTSTFPSGWTLDTVLVEAPLVDASLVPPTPGVASSDGR
jgi:hypothetical protein